MEEGFNLFKMSNLSTQRRPFSGDINYLIIEYLKSAPFSDINQKELLIKKVSNKIYLY